MTEFYVIKNKRTKDPVFKGFFSSFKDALECAVAQGISLKGADLSRKNLSCANLDGTDFSGADFSGSTLHGTNLSECDFTGADFSNASMVDACLCESVFKDVIFFETSFSATDFAGASIVKCLFSCPSFFSVKLRHIAVFEECIFYAQGHKHKMSAPPLIVSGMAYDLIVLDKVIAIGNDLKSFDEWKRILSCKDSISLKSEERFARRTRNLVHALIKQLQPTMDECIT